MTTLPPKLTPEQYKARATMEQAFKAAAAQNPPDVDSLRGCVTMAINIAKALNMPLKDLQGVVSEEFTLWEAYVEVKLRVIANRGKKK